MLSLKSRWTRIDAILAYSRGGPSLHHPVAFLQFDGILEVVKGIGLTEKISMMIEDVAIEGESGRHELR